MKTKGKKSKSTSLTWWGSQVQSLLPVPNLADLTTGQVVEIPDDYEIIPAVKWAKGRPHFYRVAVKKTKISGDFSVTKKRRNKSA